MVLKRVLNKPPGEYTIQYAAKCLLINVEYLKGHILEIKFYALATCPCHFSNIAFLEHPGSANT